MFVKVSPTRWINTGVGNIVEIEDMTPDDCDPGLVLRYNFPDWDVDEAQTSINVLLGDERDAFLKWLERNAQDMTPYPPVKMTVTTPKDQPLEKRLAFIRKEVYFALKVIPGEEQDKALRDALWMIDRLSVALRTGESLAFNNPSELYPTTPNPTNDPVLQSLEVEPPTEAEQLLYRIQEICNTAVNKDGATAFIRDLVEDYRTDHPQGEVVKAWVSEVRMVGNLEQVVLTDKHCDVCGNPAEFYDTDAARYYCDGHYIPF